MIRELVSGDGFCRVESFSGLLVDFMDRVGAKTIVRGLRAVSDFEYEFQMALMNRHLNPRIETVFLMPKEEYSYLSSRLVKEVFRLGGELDGLVPPTVLVRMTRRLRVGAGAKCPESRFLRPRDAEGRAARPPRGGDAPRDAARAGAAQSRLAAGRRRRRPARVVPFQGLRPLRRDLPRLLEGAEAPRGLPAPGRRLRRRPGARERALLRSPLHDRHALAERAADRRDPRRDDRDDPRRRARARRA